MKRKQKLQKLLMIVLCLNIIPLFVCPSNAKAGGLNANEAQVIAALSGTFYYNGQAYHAAGGYLSEAKNYLCQDNIDLTEEECSQVIGNISANVEMAVDNGYIILSDSKNKEPDKSKEDVESKTDTKKKTDLADNTLSAEIEKDKNLEKNNQNIVDKNITEPDIFSQKEKNEDQSNLSQEENASIQKNSSEIQVSGIIKNAGFNLGKTIETGKVMALLFLTTLLAYIAYFFAKKHEQKV